MGDRGMKGDQGLKGQLGEKGDLGYPGYKGEKGHIGEPGYNGTKGDMGFKGEPGQKGLKGTQGVMGDRGDKGVKGNPAEIKNSIAFITTCAVENSVSVDSIYFIYCRSCVLRTGKVTSLSFIYFVNILCVNVVYLNMNATLKKEL